MRLPDLRIRCYGGVEFQVILQFVRPTIKAEESRALLGQGRSVHEVTEEDVGVDETLRTAGDFAQQHELTRRKGCNRQIRRFHGPLLDRP